MSRYGLVTEKVAGVTFVQRRFHSQGRVRVDPRCVARAGIDPAGKEAKACFTPSSTLAAGESVATLPLAELVSVTSGGELDYGRRFVEVDGRPKLMH